MSNYTEKTMKNTQPKTKLQKFIILMSAFICTILAAVLVSVCVILVSREFGKNDLYKEVAGQKPSFNLGEESTAGEGDREENINGAGNNNNAEDDETKNDNSLENETTKPGDDLENNTTENSDEIDNNDIENNTTEDDSDTGDNNIEETTEKRPSGDIDIEVPGEDENYDIIYKGTKYRYNEDIITLLLLGIDKNGPVESGIDGGQSDVIALLVMNPDTKTMEVLSIHRDTIAMVDIYNEDGSYKTSGYTQICLAHGYGDGKKISNERAKKAVSKLLFGLPIHSVTSMNIGGVEKLNDAIGGVKVTPQQTFESQGYYFEKGKPVLLKGMQATCFIRYRDKSEQGSALKRLDNQQIYMKAFMTQVLSAVKKDIGVISDIYKIVDEYVVTDLTLNEINYLTTEAAGYKFKGITTFPGQLDTTGNYERYYLDEASLYDIVISRFYEKA